MPNMWETVEQMLAEGMDADSETEHPALRDVKLEARAIGLNDAVNALIVKWNRQLLVDCNTPEQMTTFRCMILVLLQLQHHMTGQMKGPR